VSFSRAKEVCRGEVRIAIRPPWPPSELNGASNRRSPVALKADDFSAVVASAPDSCQHFFRAVAVEICNVCIGNGSADAATPQSRSIIGTDSDEFTLMRHARRFSDGIAVAVRGFSVFRAVPQCTRGIDLEVSSAVHWMVVRTVGSRYFESRRERGPPRLASVSTVTSPEESLAA